MDDFDGRIAGKLYGPVFSCGAQKAGLFCKRNDATVKRNQERPPGQTGPHLLPFCKASVSDTVTLLDRPGSPGTGNAQAELVKSTRIGDTLREHHAGGTVHRSIKTGIPQHETPAPFYI